MERKLISTIAFLMLFGAYSHASTILVDHTNLLSFNVGEKKVEGVWTTTGDWQVTISEKSASRTMQLSDYIYASNADDAMNQRLGTHALYLTEIQKDYTVVEGKTCAKRILVVNIPDKPAGEYTYAFGTVAVHCP